MEELESARRAIDEIDGQMAALFEARMAQVARVAAYKQEHDIPVLDASREQQVIERNTARIRDAALRPYYQEFQQAAMAVSRQYQAHALGRDTVAYQGVEGAFAHIALTRLFPQAKAMACPTWGDVFDRVEQGSAAYGVLPFENSHAGDVAAVLDLCYARRLHIVEMYDLPVTQNLLAVPGATLGDLRRVISHPQALSQCERFIRSMGLAAESCANTALAARRVAEAGDKALAAIASADTAELYGLQVLMRDVNTDGDNTTRFIVVGKELPKRGNRFSLLFTVDHKTGALARVIQAIAAAGFNMECIKSRPMPRVPFEYYFYVELVGAADAPDAKRLLAGLESVCRTVRVLGIYTRKGETV